MLEIGETYTHGGKSATIDHIDEAQQATFIRTTDGKWYGKAVFNQVFLGLKK